MRPVLLPFALLSMSFLVSCPSTPLTQEEIRHEVELIEADLNDVVVAYPQYADEVAAVIAAVELALGGKGWEAAFSATDALMERLDPEEDQLLILGLAAARSSMRRLASRTPTSTP